MVDENGASCVKSHSLGIRIQKKILGKMASRSVARHFIDDDAGKILDALYAFLKEAKSEVEAKKLIKCIIKIIIKLGILYSNEKLSPNEKQLLKQMIRNFSKLIMTLVTFWEVAFSYDEQHLVTQLRAVENTIITIITPHLTSKSERRVRYVFTTMTDSVLLGTLFRPPPDDTTRFHSPYLDVLAPILRDYVFGKDPETAPSNTNNTT